MQLEIDDAVADGLVRSVLLDAYAQMRESLEKLGNCPNLKDYQQQDLDYYRTMAPAMRLVIEYFSTSDEMKQVP